MGVYQPHFGDRKYDGLDFESRLRESDRDKLIYEQNQYLKQLTKQLEQQNNSQNYSSSSTYHISSEPIPDIKTPLRAKIHFFLAVCDIPLGLIGCMLSSLYLEGPQVILGIITSILWSLILTIDHTKRYLDISTEADEKYNKEEKNKKSEGK